MRFLLVMAVLLTAFGARTGAANECPGPSSGEIQNTPIHFTYESWKKTRDRESDWLFQHCLENQASSVLWFDWPVAGLRGYLKMDSPAVNARTALFDTQKSTTAALWYGPAKVREDTTLIQRPDEKDRASLLTPRVQLAQFGGLPQDSRLPEALQGPDGFQTLLAERRIERVVLFAYGSVGVPVTPYAVDSLAIYPDDPAVAMQFITVKAEVSQTLTLGPEDSLLSQRRLWIGIDEREFMASREFGAYPIEVEFTVPDGSRLPRLPGLDNKMTLEGSGFAFVEEAPQPLTFPPIVAPETLVLTFATGEAQIALSFDSLR